MSKYQLSFISDEDIRQHVRETVYKYSTSINLEQFNKNIIDPIKLTFDAKIYGLTLEQVIESECVRQIDKTNTNHIGYFHQNLFRYAGRGWEVPTTGFDVVNRDRHIYVEIKNKHNTMNSASSSKTYMKMQGIILKDDQALCLLVETIAKQSQDIKWSTTIDDERYSHNRIRRMSMDKFYAFVFEDELAFYKLCIALPQILDDVIQEVHAGSIKNTVYEELRNLSSETLKSLFLLAFGSYAGFSQLRHEL